MRDINSFVNKIVCGNCIELMKEIPDNSVDLVVTSPPYNCDIEYDNYKDKISWEEYYVWCEKWLREIYRIVKDDGRVAIVHYLSMGDSIVREAPLMEINHIGKSIGFKHHSIGIWWDTTLSTNTAWGSWLSASSPYVNSPFEGILILYKKRWKKDKKGESTLSKEEFIEDCGGVWKIGTEKNRTHPAPFPLKLAQRCINLLSYKGDIVLDPFNGSGTTTLACKNLGRKYIGIDMSKIYCSMSEDRLKQEVLF